MNKTWVRLRPAAETDLPMLRRFASEPGLVGPSWSGYRDPGAVAKRYALDGFLGEDDGRLVVDVDDTAAGYVSWQGVSNGAARYWKAGGGWSIGIALLPEWRGRGVGWRAQTLLCEYLFTHTPAERIEAIAQSDNIAEHKSLEKVGFQREAVLRCAEFRDGQWRDLVLFGRLRSDR
jgi:RimJ/RimL family protein N-acetyltransferase